MKKRIIIFTLILVIFSTAFIYPQSKRLDAFYRAEVDFIIELEKKENATFSDLVQAFCYMNDINVEKSFEANLENLQEIIVHLPKNFTEEKMLTFGDFSLFAMQHLKIKGSLWYSASKTGRYAVRELALLKVIPFNTSEWEKMSGIELIRYMQKVAEYEETK